MILIELTKICSNCGKRKLLGEFHKRKGGRFGITAKCKICENIYHRARRAADPVKVMERKNTQARDRRAANLQEIRAKERAYRANNQGYKLNSCMRSGIGKSLKHGEGNNGRHLETLVPYTLDDSIEHLKKTLSQGCTWGNYISGNADLHIDHIIPISAHNFKSTTDTDFARCWELGNLRSLPAIENMSKNAKLIKHFQPSLF